MSFGVINGLDTGEADVLCWLPYIFNAKKSQRAQLMEKYAKANELTG
jgi:hypothetical protein